MNVIKIISSVYLVLAFCGCSLTLPVQGVSDKRNEVFTGTATGYLSGNGILKVDSNNGFSCLGEFKYASTHDKGIGAFGCDDGRQGDFAFTSSGVNGIGYAQLADGTLAQFLFGSTPSYSGIDWIAVRRNFETLSVQMEGMVYYCEKYPKTLKCLSRSGTQTPGPQAP